MKTTLIFALFSALTVTAATSAPTAFAQELPSVAVKPHRVDLSFPAEALVEAVQQTTVGAQIAGRVIEVKADAGQNVKKGEVLMRIDAREAEEAARAANAQYANARLNYERTKSLVAQKFMSAAALDKARADYDAASASRAAAAAGESHATIVAPLTGVVARRHAELGDMATPGKPLFTLYEPGGLRVTASIPQYKLAEVRANRRAKVEFPETGKWVDAAKVEVFPAADPRTHTVQARVYLPDNLPGVIPGMFARAHFVTGKAKKLLVPAAAVLRRGEVTAVYVIDDKNIARLRQLRLSEPLAGGFHEVLAGVSAGEKVALDPVKAGIIARPAQ